MCYGFTQALQRWIVRPHNRRGQGKAFYIGKQVNGGEIAGGAPEFLLPYDATATASMLGVALAQQATACYFE